MMHEQQLVLNGVLPVVPVMRARPGNKVVRDIPVQQLLMQVFIHVIKKVFRTTVNNE